MLRKHIKGGYSNTVCLLRNICLLKQNKVSARYNNLADNLFWWSVMRIVCGAELAVSWTVKGLFSLALRV